jgi:hypothetical protein
VSVAASDAALEAPCEAPDECGELRGAAGGRLRSGGIAAIIARCLCHLHKRAPKASPAAPPVPFLAGASPHGAGVPGRRVWKERPRRPPADSGTYPKGSADVSVCWTAAYSDRDWRIVSNSDTPGTVAGT